MTAAVPRHPRHIKAHLLPLSPVARMLEWIVERLPRRVVRIRLKPASPIIELNSSRGEYNAPSDVPIFEIDLTPDLAKGGWFYMEAAVVRHNGSREARLHGIARGGGFDIPIPSNLRGSVREVFFLPFDVVKVYWSPTTSCGLFSQSELVIHRITKIESAARRAHRVLLMLWTCRGVSLDHTDRLTLVGAMSDLHASYLATARTQIRRFMGDDYDQFIRRNDRFDTTECHRMTMSVAMLARRPLISLIVPVRNPSRLWLTAMVESVSNQIYDNWELLLVGDLAAMPDANLDRICNDGRIKLVNGASPLAASLNSLGLESARGEYVALIGQHDAIPPYALAYIALEIERYPATGLIYTDHDELDEHGKRCNPSFKPDWNPDYLTSRNYIGNLCVYGSLRAKSVGGFRVEMAGADDYDLLLRYMRDLPSSRIRHIPRVLYHQRAVVCSPYEEDIPTGPEAHSAGKRVLMDYFSGNPVSVLDGPAKGLYRVRRLLPASPPLVSIIIPTRDKLDVLRSCVESIRQKTTYPAWELLIVDNGSVESGTLRYLAEIQEDRRIRVLTYEQEFNYSAINNFAVRHSQGDVLALLNNDVEVITPEWLTEMVSHANRPEIGAVGAKLLYATGLVQHAGVVLGIGGVAGHAHKYFDGEALGYEGRASVIQNFSAVTGACLVVRKKLFEEVGGLNEANLKVALNDVDFCLKLRQAGYNNLFTPYARLYHHESISRGRDDTPAKRATLAREVGYMRVTWGHLLNDDFAYNRNLTLEFEDFSYTYWGRPQTMTLVN